MFTWFARSTREWRGPISAWIVGIMDEVDSVWEPFLSDDDLEPTEPLPAI